MASSAGGCLFRVQVEFADTSIVITEPYFNFSSIQESMNEILFEEYQFQSALRINGESSEAQVQNKQTNKQDIYSHHPQQIW